MLGNLNSGNIKSCGCMRYKYNPRVNLVGQKFGKLTVTREKKIEEYPGNKRKRVEWYCDCSCGTKDHVVSTSNLKGGSTLSCGCYHKEDLSKNRTIDITGQKFGKLTVLHKSNKTNKRKEIFWVCKCECGTITTVSGVRLRNGRTVSCGCLTSKNEDKIRRLLIDHNIRFQTQFWIDDLRNPKTGYPLKFDFAVFDNNNCLIMFIEYDGEQHFTQINYSQNQETNNRVFKDLKYRDKLKNKYCKQNGFSLFRIPYIYEDQVEKLVLGALKEKGLIERND